MRVILSFWGDLKSLTIESAKAIGTGVELLSEVAEEANKASQRLLAETRIARLEKELATLAEGPGSDPVRAEKCGQLLRLYDELEKLGGGVSDTDIAARKKLISQDLSRQTVRRLLALIESLEKSIAKSRFSLPVQEISQKQRLLSQIDALLVQLNRGSQGDMAESFFAKKKAILADIAHLESLRATEEVSHYSSGGQFSYIEKYDGRRHGFSRYWYESGYLKLQIKYDNGQIYGPLSFWREDGSILFRGERLANSNLKLTGYLRNGGRVFQGELGQNGYCNIWFAGVVYAGRMKIENGRVQKLGFLFRLFFNFLFWRSYWRIFRSEGGPALMDETLQVIRQFDAFVGDLSLLAMGQDPTRAKTVAGKTRVAMGLNS